MATSPFSLNATERKEENQAELSSGQVFCSKKPYTQEVLPLFSFQDYTHRFPEGLLL